MSVTEGTRRTVPWWVYAIVGVVLIGIVVVLAVAGRGGSSEATATPVPSETSAEPGATASGSAEPTASGAPSEGATATPSDSLSGGGSAETTSPEAVAGMFGDRPVRVAPVASPAESNPGVTVRVTKVSAVTASGTGIGEYSGPGLLVEVEIENGTKNDLALDAVAVTAYRTRTVAPVASVASDDAVVPFSGTLPAGDSARAAYVFVSPGTDALSVAVLTALDASVVVFDGVAAANG